MDTAREDKLKATLKVAREAIRSLTEEAESLKKRLAAPGAPIAIVGMAGEFPGAGTSADAFRKMLLDGVDAAGPVPPSRWDHNRYYATEPGTPGKYYSARACFLARDPFAFDCRFFGLSPAEAEMMDPQQRLLMTQSHHALEDAGIAPSSLQGSDAGVFLGFSSFDYLMAFATPELEGRADPYVLTGSSFNSAAGRLSYYYDIHGPCTAVDTACSSSLVAVLTAVEALRKGACPVAFAGGVNLLLSPLSFVALSAIHALSADGLCRAFGEGATGFGRGEGGGIVILKRLDDALAAGDRIHAVILGGAIGHDGQSAGFTAPSGHAQRRVIERALRDAGVAPSEIGYVETHGTGTDLGDPIEATALAETFGERTPKLLIGSVKSNVGHLEAAAGMAALFKAVFAVRDGAIPPSLHADMLSSRIDWPSLPLEVCRKRTAWANTYPRRIAGVSSFGISGTLAHLVLAPPPAGPRNGDATAAKPASDWCVLPLSAANAESLARLAGLVEARLRESACALDDTCGKAALGRDHLAHRIAVCANSTAQAADALAACSQGKRSRDAASGIAGKRPVTAFLFSGQGSQSPGMGRELYQTHRAFRDTMDACDRLAAGPLGCSLREVMFGDEAARLNRTRFTQPAIFAMGAALADLWRSFGIRPGVVVGHSIGEYAAAYAAGVCTLEAGMEIVLERARLADRIATPGTMAAVLTDEETARRFVAGTDVDIAAVNATGNVTLSGPAEAVAGVCAKMLAANIAFREMPVSQAFHSTLIEPALPDFDRFLRGRSFAAPTTRFLSSMTGSELTGQTDWRSYWTEQMRRTVNFKQALGAIGPVDIYLEVGASPTLTSLCRADTKGGQWLFSQGPGVPAWRQIFLTLSRLYAAGCAVDWSAAGANRCAGADIPLYPFHESLLRPPPPEAVETRRPVAAGNAYPAGTPAAAIMELQTQSLNRLFEWQMQTLSRLQTEEARRK